MDLIRINENKLKIMLTPLDMQSYELCADELDCTNIETREAFRSIMDEARNRTGFDAGGNQIYVQLYPSKSGGCELFVTKLGLLCEKNHAAGRASKAPTEQKTERYAVFSFEKLDHLLRVCRQLKPEATKLQSAVYHGEEGCYYLLLWQYGKDRYTPLFDRATLAFLHEYGTPKDASAMRLYIKEHADAVCERRAVETLAKL